MVVKFKYRYRQDIIIFLQKTYGLYFVEQRNNHIILHHPDNKDWWVAVFKTCIVGASIGVSKEDLNLAFIKKDYLGFSKRTDWLNV